MKIGEISIGARASIGAASTILYDSSVGDDAQLGPLTLVTKGESIPASSCWTGSPARPAG
jgi:acetyltransferase-like isoleucine patch superfamily enzyme